MDNQIEPYPDGMSKFKDDEDEIEGQRYAILNQLFFSYGRDHDKYMFCLMAYKAQFNFDSFEFIRVAKRV